MSIQNKRSEILRLIGRLGQSNGPGLSEVRDRLHGPLSRGTDRRPQRSPDAAVAHRRRLEKQQAALSALRDRRDALAVSGPAPTSLTETDEPRLAGVLTRIEERIAAIEARLQSGSASSAPALAGGAALPSNCTLGGGLRDGLLSDLLQLVSSNEWTGEFVVDGGEDSEIRLDFVEGEIWNARAPGITGQDAVFALMGRVEGAYYFQETGTTPEGRTVEGNTQFLILEGLRRLDELGEGS